MSEQGTQSATWSLATALTAVGGFLAAAGVILPWASTTGFRTTEIFGEEVVGTTSSNGLGDVIGLVTLLTGLAIGVLGVVALLRTGEAVRRAAGIAAIVGGIAILAACVLGAVRVDAVLGELPLALADPQVAVETSVAAGLFVSAAGGAIAAAGGFIARRAPAPS